MLFDLRWPGQTIMGSWPPANRNIVRNHRRERSFNICSDGSHTRTDTLTRMHSETLCCVAPRYVTSRRVALQYTTLHLRTSTSNWGCSLGWVAIHYFVTYHLSMVFQGDARSEKVIISGLQARSCEDGLKPSLWTSLNFVELESS